jgi:enoyl-CoA hydratase/carnithine racemase
MGTPNDEILHTVEDGIATIVFNRPQARNALTFGMYERLAEICAAAPSDPSVRAILITGAGDKAFAAGTDISLFRNFSGAQDAIRYESRMEEVLEALEACPLPTIAAIAGACTGGGAAIAAVCDIRIAAANARFGFPIARTLGNCLSAANHARLVGLLGEARVKHLIFTAGLMEAGAAHAAGLYAEVVADTAALLPRAREVARLVASHAPLTLRATKEALRRLRVASSRVPDEDLVTLCYTSEDFREGMEAFLNKRPPVWRGR